MTMKEFGMGFFRHTARALLVFAVMIVLSEWAAPRSVSPYIDPIPIVIVALLLQSIDAVFWRKL